VVNRVQLDVSLEHDSAISIAQRVVDDLSGRLFGDQDIGWRLAMATHELLDNALRYGRDGTANLVLLIEQVQGGRTASVRVRSRADGEAVQELRRRVGRLGEAKDAWAFYIDAMRQTARETTGSGLGLARLSAEGEMTVSLAEEAPDFVSVLAELRIEGTGS
jgi:hypothetical protein